MTPRYYEFFRFGGYFGWISEIQNRAGEALDNRGHKVVENGDFTKEQRAGKIHLYTITQDEIPDHEQSGKGIAFEALKGKIVWVKKD